MVRRTLVILLVIVVAMIAACCVAKAYTYRHFYDGYESSLPLNATTTDPVPVDKPIKAFGQDLHAQFRSQRIEFDARPGERVPALLTMPMEATQPVPAIVLLHGSDQEKEFVEEIATPFNQAGFAVVCFDQYMRGERRVRGSVITIGRAYRERCWKTVHDTRRLIDYLQTRPDVDRDRIYLIGASYGAITGTAVVAQERRIKAAILVVGGGNCRLIAKAPEVRRELPGWLAPFAGSLLTLVMGPADPILHAPKTAGIPVLMQNGSNDGVVIPEAGNALFAALGEPKEIRWYPIDHPDREKKGEEVIRLLDDGLKWLVEQDAAHRRVTAG
jgi:dienelactone hydrolase